MKQIQKSIARGTYDPNRDDPFELFISSTNVRWCYYKDSHKILGNTYGMCVLQVRWTPHSANPNSPLPIPTQQILQVIQPHTTVIQLYTYSTTSWESHTDSQ